MPDTESIKSRLLNKLMEQGLLFVFMGIGIWFFTNQNKVLQIQVTECHKAQIVFFQEQRDLMLKAVEERTAILEKIGDRLND